MKKSIQITIAGESGSGKTTIAQFLQKCLGQIGIESNVTDGVTLDLPAHAAAEVAAANEDSFQERIKELVGRDQFKVEIATAQLRRIGM